MQVQFSKTLHELSYLPGLHFYKPAVVPHWLTGKIQKF